MSYRRLIFDIIILTVFFYISIFIGVLVTEIINFNFSTANHIPLIRFPYSTFIRLFAIVVCSLLYMKFQCKNRANEMKAAYIFKLALGVSIFNTVITILFIAQYINHFSTIIILILTVLLFLWFFYANLMFGNYLFNKQTKNKSKLSVINFLVVILLLIGTMLLSSNEDFTKAQWVEKFKNEISTTGCESLMKDPQGQKILQSKNMNLAQCKELTKTYAQECLDKYNNDIPVMLNSIIMSYWGKKIGACMDQEMATYFDTDFFLPKKR